LTPLDEEGEFGSNSMRKSIYMKIKWQYMNISIKLVFAPNLQTCCHQIVVMKKLKDLVLGFEKYSFPCYNNGTMV